MSAAGGLYRGATFLLGPLAPAGLALWAPGEDASLRAERLGKGPAEPVDTWWHAASLGEVGALEPVLAAAIARNLAGNFLVTTTTRTGRAAAASRWPGRAALAPLDLPGPVRRATAARRPRTLVLVETELWPNWLRALHANGTRLAVVNARVSDRSWGRYRRWRGALREILPAFRAIAARGDVDAARFRELGARAEAVRVTGNTKHDRPASSAPAALPWSSGPVWTAGSLRPGEEDVILEAFARLRRVRPDLRLVLALRHPAQWEDLPGRLAARGLGVAIRSRPFPGDSAALVLILDTQGELAGMYAASTVAFVGGTLVPLGGHNVMEAASAGLPVVFGPHRASIAEDARALLEGGAAREVRDAESMASAIAPWLDDPEARERAAAAARAIARAGRGAALRSLAWLLEREVFGPDAPPRR